MTEPRPVGESLDRLMKGLSGGTSDAVSRLFGEWEELVGPLLGSASRPLEIDGHRLVVGVDDPAMASQLRWLEPDIRRALADRLGLSVQRIDVRVRPSFRGPAR